MKELIVRGLSGTVYIAIVIASMFVSREWFIGLFTLLAVITLFEFLKIVHLKSYLAYALLLAGLYFFSYSIFDHYALLLLLILCGLINLFLLKDLFATSKIPMFEKKKYIFVILYLISGFIFLMNIPYRNETFTPQILLVIFILIWSNDSFAYLIGKNFGKIKLLERVSPKKTVAGFFGGLVGTIIASFIIFNLTGLYNLPIWLGMATLISVFGTIGDLIQSKFKRQAGVKDSGTLMPGHGGMYDRLDSIVYTSPFVYAFLEIIDYVS
ncbi:MAG: phosphatidate cytidylyltransferase [Candidatus Latescibacterota bacterium]|jgi:phosphatidate cytidylyltransferase